MARTAENIVRVEVHYCVSALVSTLAAGCNHSQGMTTDFAETLDQAWELCLPIDDYEEAAVQKGFIRYAPGQDVTPPDAESEWWYLKEDPSSDWFNSAREACEANDIEPYQREVFEHWIVSDWLADRLAEKGEKVDKDFAGMTVWARTTTGQGIASDWVIEQIAADLNKGA